MFAVSFVRIYSSGMSLRDTLRFIILSGIFIIPFICLYVADSMFFPFITGKNFTFRILVEIMVGAWGILMVIDRAFRPRFSYALVAAGSFLGIIALADFLGVNPFRSFWSNYERMEGLVTHIHLFFYFLVAGTVLQEERMWKWLLRTSLAASMLIAFVAMQQLFGFTETHQSATRLDATLGNSTYLAIYALFHIFIAAFLYLRDGVANSVRWLYPVTMVVNTIVLIYTQTRGSVVGLFAGAMLTFLLIAFFDRTHPRLKKIATGGIVALLLLIGSFILVKDTQYMATNPVFSRLAAMSLTEQTVVSRFLIWNMSWEGFKERPILGWGQENFIYVFSKYYDPRMYNQEPWFDRSHDVFFDWLIAGGILGLLSYLSLFGVIIYYLWFTKKGNLTVSEKAVITGMLAGYFVHNIFVFDNLVSYILFFTILAYVHAHYADPLKEVVTQKEKKKNNNDVELQDILIASTVIILATVFVLYMVNIRNINANMELINALKNPLTREANGQAAITLKEVLDKKLFGNSEAREQLGQLAFQAADPRLDQAIREKIYNYARSEFEDEIANDPDNLRYQTFIAMLYARFGQFQDAENAFKRAIELSPNRQTTYMDLGTMYLQMKRMSEAEMVLKKAYELEPNFYDARLMYGVSLIYNAKFAEAEAVLEKIRKDNVHVQFDNRLVNAYGNMRQFDKVLQVVNEKIAQNKAVGRDYLALGGAYVELGQRAKAIEAFEQAKKMDTTLTEEADSYINSARAGK